MYTDWYNKGITYFKDIVNNTDKTIYSFANLKDKFHLTDNDFFKYLSLVRSIQNIWKINIKNEILNTPIMPTLIRQVLKAKQTNKYIYTYILRKQSPVNNCEQKWNEKFINETLNWKTIYTSTLVATNDIKLRNFQYKFIMRIIPNNKFLQKCGIADSALCEFCNMVIETTGRLFWECTYIQQFWTEICKFLTDFNIGLILNLPRVFFGLTFTMNEPDSRLKNFLILLGKYFIFSNKYRKTIPTLNHFKYYLCKRIKIEKEIYFMKDKLTHFETIWGRFRNFKMIFTEKGRQFPKAYLKHHFRWYKFSFSSLSLSFFCSENSL